MKTESLGEKLAQTLTEVKVDTLVTLLSKVRAEALVDTLNARLTDVEIETLGETVVKIRRGAYRQISHVLRSADVETVNETVALVKAQALVDTSRHTSTRRNRRTWQHTTKFKGLRFSRHNGRQTGTGGGSDT